MAPVDRLPGGDGDARRGGRVHGGRRFSDFPVIGNSGQRADVAGFRSGHGIGPLGPGSRAADAGAGVAGMFRRDRDGRGARLRRYVVGPGRQAVRRRGDA